MDIATEEFSHLEIVGATIQMLLQGVNGDLKNAAENSYIMHNTSEVRGIRAKAPRWVKQSNLLFYGMQLNP